MSVTSDIVTSPCEKQRKDEPSNNKGSRCHWSNICRCMPIGKNFENHWYTIHGPMGVNSRCCYSNTRRIENLWDQNRGPLLTAVLARTVGNFFYSDSRENHVKLIPSPSFSSFTLSIPFKIKLISVRERILATVSLFLWDHLKVHRSRRHRKPLVVW